MSCLVLCVLHDSNFHRLRLVSHINYFKKNISCACIFFILILDTWQCYRSISYLLRLTVCDYNMRKNTHALEAIHKLRSFPNTKDYKTEIQRTTVHKYKITTLHGASVTFLPLNACASTSFCQSQNACRARLSWLISGREAAVCKSHPAQTKLKNARARDDCSHLKAVKPLHRSVYRYMVWFTTIILPFALC